MKTLADQRARRLGTTRAQWVILLRLNGRDGMRQIDLATEMEVEPITVARLLDRLEAAGQVERRADPKDRRVKRAYLTEEGRNTLTRFSSTADSIIETALAGLSMTDMVQLETLLEKIKSNCSGALGCDTIADRAAPEERRHAR